jgi:nucleoside-diphosphate-sugar epimerase
MLLAADAHHLAGTSVNVARGVEVSVREIARLVLEACGRTDLAPEFGAERPADVRRHYADISLARRALAFEPQVNIQDGIAKYVAWFRATFPDPSVLLPREQAYNWEPVS